MVVHLLVLLFSWSLYVGYGSSESTFLPCLGVSGRVVSVSTCPRNECKSTQLKIISLKCSPKHMSFICKASTGGHRRNPDFSRQNWSGFSRNKNRSNEEDNFDNLDESKFLSTKNGPLLSVSNSSKSHATAASGPKEREIVELFRKVQAQLHQRAAVKEERKFEMHKGQTKESETVDSLLKLLRKHSVEQGKRKVNGGSGNEFNFDHPRQSGESNEDKSKSFFNSSSIVRDEPQETNKPSFSRPPSAFRRRSPVPRVRYEPIVSPSDLDVKTDDTLPEPVNEPESDLDMDLISGLELEQEEERKEEAERESEVQTDFVDETAVDTLSEANFLDAEEEDDSDEKDSKTEHTEMKDMNTLKLSELRAIAKVRGLKGFSKLKKSELVGLLSEDSM